MPDREVFQSMDACVRGVPCIRGGLVDPISAGPVTPRKTLDGRRGLIRSREGGKEEETRRASRSRVPVYKFRSYAWRGSHPNKAKKEDKEKSCRMLYLIKL